MRAISSGEVYLSNSVWLASDVEMETFSRINIGEGTTIQRRSTINGTVEIGRSCIIAPNVFISSGTHPFRVYPEKTIREQERIIIEKEGDLSSLDRPVVIGDDCWLGVNVVICPGVSIGKGVVVGANSVVVNDIPDNTVVAGVPAKSVGSRFT
ncbi:acyltransferase [Halomonas salifodinae]|uniref:Acyltransferase n=1 Tax=Halomonas salifodinae TaxID=438745 RepID=A0ABW2EXL6_9GAMM